MASGETSLGGPNRAFRTTIWSDILAVGDPSAPGSREKLTSLLQTYWKPVYTYVRLSWRKPVEDAKDLTQSFFAHLLEKGAWSRVSPEKGTFRSYLKRALQNFLINAKDHDDVRRAVAPVVSIDIPDRPDPAAPGDTPDRAFDREWFRAVMDASVAELEKFLAAEGKAPYFEIFRLYCLDGGEPESPEQGYRDVAARLGIGENDVRNHLFYARRVLQRIVRERVRDTVPNDEDVEREVREAAGG